MTVRVDAQAAATEALAICAECRKLDEAALSGDPKWMGDGDDIWSRTNRLLALIEPVAEGYVALAARLEAAETALRQIEERTEGFISAIARQALAAGRGERR